MAQALIKKMKNGKLKDSWKSWAKKSAFWIIVFYCVKGTAVTVVAVGAVLLAL